MLMPRDPCRGPESSRDAVINEMLNSGIMNPPPEDVGDEIPSASP